MKDRRSGTARGAATAAVLPFAPVATSGQPQPARVHLSHLRGVTAITRVWADRADVERCRLCPPGRCGAGPYNVCQVQVVGLVTPDQAPLFRLPVAAAGREADGAAG